MPKLSDRLKTHPLLPVSGTYMSAHSHRSARIASEIFATNSLETVRLDVDGTYPQMMASGSYQPYIYSLSRPSEWVAYPLRQIDNSTWEGSISHVWGTRHFIPHSHVRLHVLRTSAPSLASTMTITYFGGSPDVQRKLKYVSPWFRNVTVEFDREQGSPQVTWVNTCAHADHPPSLTCENLTFDQAYDRAGVEITRSLRRSVLTLNEAGPDWLWSDLELNDAMHKYWSGYSDYPDWAIWFLFANRHEESGLFGRMFDSSDTNQRQGVAIFNKNIEENTPLYYPQRPEHLNRLRFHIAVHETAHCFNLHHPGKSYNSNWEWPYDYYDRFEPSYTFMQYDHKVPFFYDKFEYRFDDDELQFLRHSPNYIVEMGDEPFFDSSAQKNRAFAPRAVSLWKLNVDSHRLNGLFEFLEPVTLSITLTNISAQPQLVDESILENSGNLTIVIDLPNGSQRLWRPLTQQWFVYNSRVLESNSSISCKLVVAVGRNGWYIAEPGSYSIHVMLKMPEAVVAATPVRLRIMYPCRLEEQQLAQDYFTKDVARALAFGGTHSMTNVLRILQELVERLPASAAAHHAALTLAQPWMKDRRTLELDDKVDRKLQVISANHEEARRLFELALINEPERAAAALGTSGYCHHLELYADWLSSNGDKAGACQVLSLLRR